MTSAPGLGEGERERPQAGPDLDHPVARARPRPAGRCAGRCWGRRRSSAPAPGSGESPWASSRSRTCRGLRVTARGYGLTVQSRPYTLRRCRPGGLGHGLRPWRPWPRPAAAPTSGQQRRPVGPAAVRHRRQVGAVGLDQHPVERADGGRGPHVVGRLERDDARERQVPAPVEARLGLGRAAGEAVEHRALGHALGVEDGERVVPGLAGVDHERQVVLVGEADLRGEHPALHVAGRVVVVVVEPALPHRHDAGLAQQVGQTRRARRGRRAGAGPTVAHTTPGWRAAAATASAERAAVGADGDQALDPGARGHRRPSVDDAPGRPDRRRPSRGGSGRRSSAGARPRRLPVRCLHNYAGAAWRRGSVVGLLGPVRVGSPTARRATLRGHAARLLALAGAAPRPGAVGRRARRAAVARGRPADGAHRDPGTRVRPAAAPAAPAGPVRIETVPGGYALRSTQAAVDRPSAAFDLDEPVPASTGPGRAPAPRPRGRRRRGRARRAALALWRGPALADLRDDPGPAAARPGARRRAPRRRGARWPTR